MLADAVCWVCVPVSDFADVLLDDPDALPTLRCYVPYDEPRPADPETIEIYDAALEVMLLAAGERSTTPVAYAGQLKFPVRAGEMIAWSVCEVSGRTVDMTMIMLLAEEVRYRSIQTPKRPQ